MRKIELKSIICEYESLSELASGDRELVEKARQATHTAYAPYSGFYVGAAIRLENGIVICGSNQENAAFPSGLCAERVAAFAAAAQHSAVPFEAIAVTARSDKFIVDTPSSPCGACRQVLAEYEHLFKKPIRIILAGERGKIIIVDKVEDLLPLSFKSDKLIK